MKHLYRSRKDKIIAGVCGGIGQYMGIDPVIIRIIAIILFFWGGSGIIAYIIGMIIIPQEPVAVPIENKKAVKAAKIVELEKKEKVPLSRNSSALIIGIILIVLGGIFLLRNLPFFDHYYWWFRHQIGHIFWPTLLIAFGVFMIVRGTKK